MPPTPRLLALLALLAALPAAGSDHHADGGAAEHTAAWAHRTYAGSSLLQRNVSFDAPSNASDCRSALPPHECPVEDASYCAEFDWLDADCSGGLGLEEFTESASFPELKSAAQLRAYHPAAWTRRMQTMRWAERFLQLDAVRVAP
jgi:hypothetical protein